MRWLGTLLGTVVASAAAAAVSVLITRLLEEGDNALFEFGDAEGEPGVEHQVAEFMRAIDFDLPFFLKRWSQ